VPKPGDRTDHLHEVTGLSDFPSTTNHLRRTPPQMSGFYEATFQVQAHCQIRMEDMPCYPDEYMYKYMAKNMVIL
jgi:hypothetical protein